MRRLSRRRSLDLHLRSTALSACVVLQGGGGGLFRPHRVEGRVAVAGLLEPFLPICVVRHLPPIFVVLPALSPNHYHSSFTRGVEFSGEVALTANEDGFFVCGTSALSTGARRRKAGSLFPLSGFDPVAPADG